jgi:hypothetical protein
VAEANLNVSLTKDRGKGKRLDRKGRAVARLARNAGWTLIPTAGLWGTSTGTIQNAAKNKHDVREEDAIVAAEYVAAFRPSDGGTERGDRADNESAHAVK